MYHLRITSEDEKYERFIIQNFRKYLMVFEEADQEVSRTHSHTLCEEPLVKIQTIRNKLSDLTNKNENKMFSLTIVRDKEATLRYLFKAKSKDDSPIIKLCNIEIKEDYHKMYWEENDKLRKKRYKENHVFGRLYNRSKKGGKKVYRRDKHTYAKRNVSTRNENVRREMQDSRRYDHTKIV